MRRFLSKLVKDLRQTNTARAARGARRRTSLQVEGLETRQLMSGSPLPALDPIQAKYEALGGPNGFLGPALTSEMLTPYGGGLYEIFAGGAIFYSPATGAHDISSFAESEWERTANEYGGNGVKVQQILGLPTSDESHYANLPGAFLTDFQGGHLWHSVANGAHVTYGAIDAEYVFTAHETDASGRNLQTVLGLPTGDETNVPGVPGARRSTFQHGDVYWSPTTGAHAVYGAIGAKYDSVGGPAAYGLPISDEANVPGVPGVRFVQFKIANSSFGNNIYWSQATGAHLVYGAVLDEYLATANEHGADGRVVQTILGAPTSDEMNVPGVPGARMNTFQGGAIYFSSATGAHVVYGGIGAKYGSVGGPAAYGLPTSDEANVPGVPGVRFVQFKIANNSFSNNIYWSPATGAHLVHGAVLDEYLATANEHGADGRVVQTILGAPTSDEMDVPGVPGARMNTFQGGAIYFSSATGAHVVFGAIYAEYIHFGGPTSLLGLPTTDELSDASGRVSYFQRGKIEWSPQDGARVIFT